MIIATGKSRNATQWNNKEVTWEQLVNKLSKTQYTAETQAEYMRMSKDEQSEIKDIGGFVGGCLKDGKRKADSVQYRTLLTLDIDYGRPETVELIQENLPGAWLIYSTHKHSDAEPRLRLVAPFSRPVTPEEYPAIARKIAEYIDIELFDSTTYQPSRLMYYPSTSKNAPFVFVPNEGEPIDADYWLSQYEDWHDMSTWAVSSREKKLINRELKKQQNPTEKEGIVGAFCRLYDIHEAIEKYLPDVYTPTQNGRYTYVGGTTTNGVATYNDQFLYSHHDSDPCHLQLLNSFDAVRLHFFGEKDEGVNPTTNGSKLPSFEATVEYLLSDKEFKKQYLTEKVKDAGFKDESGNTETEQGEDNAEWLIELGCNAKGEIAPTFENLYKILDNDKNLKGITYNLLSNSIEAPVNSMPWDRVSRQWRDLDDSHLIVYLANNYCVFTDRVYLNCLSDYADKHSYHPIKKYLETLPEWDKVPRVENLLIDYLGADDNVYSKSVIKLFLLAAVRRLYVPGCKFDNILVIQGEQGIGKSTLISKLGGEWFSDSVTMSDTMDVKSAAEKLQGFWILEFSELQGMRNTAAAAVRGFLSRQNDIYRASYGRRVESHPRQCIFFGTTNDAGYLTDPTGNRRFFPVVADESRIIKKSWDITEADRAQIWAEVMVLHKSNAMPDLVLPPECNPLVEEARIKANDYDARTDMVAEFLDIPLPNEAEWEKFTLAQKRVYLNEPDECITEHGRLRDFVTAMEIWTECYGKNAADIQRKDQLDISLLMRGYNKTWAKGQKRINGKFTKGYRRIGSEVPDDEIL